RTQGTIGLEILLLEPRPLFVPPPQIGDQSFEPGAKRILRRLALALLPCGVGLSTACRARRAKQENVAQLFRQPAERQREIDSKRLAQRGQGFANELPVPFRPWSDRAVLERQRLVRNQTRRIEGVDRAEPLAFGAGAVRRVEREGAR